MTFPVTGVQVEKKDGKFTIIFGHIRLTFSAEEFYKIVKLFNTFTP